MTLVAELIEGLWTMGQDEFDEKYNLLSSSDMAEVSEAVLNMENELLDDDF